MMPRIPKVCAALPARPLQPLIHLKRNPPLLREPLVAAHPYSSSSHDSSTKPAPSTTGSNAPKPSDTTAKKQQTAAEADEEVKRRLEEISGEGGASGIEFENGKPASMKRSVRDNMFRYI